VKFFPLGAGNRDRAVSYSLSGERQLRILSTPTVHEVFGDERTQSQPLIQLAHQEQTTVRGDARTLEINFQRRVKRELKGLILLLTHWVEPS
jgi:hypothetical protein